jgi:hypothetical protein
LYRHYQLLLFGCDLFCFFDFFSRHYLYPFPGVFVDGVCAVLESGWQP